MENKELLYGIYLPNPNRPAHNPSPLLYVGTEDEIIKFVDRLDECTEATYFREFINAVRNFHNDPETKHTVSGHTTRAMIPVKEVGRKEFTLSDHKWVYISPASNNEYILKASLISVSYILIDISGALLRCDRAMIEDLNLSIPGIGWVALGGMHQGTPMMIHAETSPDTDPQITYMSLYRQNREYKMDYPAADALKDLPGLLDIDLNAIMAEVLGQL